MLRRVAVATLAFGLLFGSSTLSFAQRAAPKGTPAKVDGTVAQVVPGQGILVNGKDGKKYAVGFSNTSKVTMGGNASPDILKSGMFVQFTVTLDSKGVPMGDVTKLQITEPSTINVPGISSEKGPDGKPGEPGPYFVRGSVRSYREGNLTVSAGPKPLVVTVSASSSIPVTVSDWTLAAPGDTITGDVAAFPATPQFTPVLAERVEIKAVQPITGKKKR